MTQKDVVVALQRHKDWVNNRATGKQADLRGADLRKVNFEGDDLRFVDFRAADLSGSNLTRADCRHADFRGANLAGAICIGTNFVNARMEGANLQGIDLRLAVMEYAQMSGVNLGNRFQKILKGEEGKEQKPQERGQERLNGWDKEREHGGREM